MSAKCKGLAVNETYRHSDPLYVSKIPTKSISILSFIDIVNFLVQDPEIMGLQTSGDQGNQNIVGNKLVSLEEKTAVANSKAFRRLKDVKVRQIK